MTVLSAVSALLILAFIYIWFVWSTVPFIAYWRTIWVETAMTTGSHGWLATSFIPSDIIDDIMEKSVGNPDIIGGSDFLDVKGSTEKTDDTAQTDNPDKTGETLPHGELPEEDEKDLTQETGKAPEPVDTPASSAFDKSDPLGLSHLKAGDTDYAGYTVKTADADQGILISEIVGSGYKGLVMLIDDPARVYLAQTDHPGKKGMRIKEYLSRDNAIAGINASGFSDYAGQGNGGEVVGFSCSCGTIWGEYAPNYGSVVITGSDRLVVGNISVWDNYDIRDGIQFGPVLVADGKAAVTGSAGYGLQPRTAIGQREDGVIVMLVIDGRDITWSVGCTVGDMAEIMLRYEVRNAACCDGGSSSVLAYDGEILNHNSSANPNFGRMMPNAFLVRKK